MRIISKSDKQTMLIASRMAKKLHGGDVLGLIGDLGTGKTVFVKGLAKTLGVKDIIHSPTFVLMHLHKIKPSPTSPPPPRGRGRIKEGVGLQPKYLCHIDAYRLENANDLLDIGADEYIGNPEVITVIEWADKVYPVIRRGLRSASKNTKYIHIKHHPKNAPTKSRGPDQLIPTEASGSVGKNWRIIRFSN